MATLVFEVEGLGFVSSVHDVPEYWHMVEETGKGQKWICGIVWDVSKANKPTGITPPKKFNADDEYAPTVLKGSGYLGNYYMLHNSEEESMEAFKRLVAWVYDRRTTLLEKSTQEFKDGREEFLKRQFKKVK